jgi:hypothetical protein
MHPREPWWYTHYTKPSVSTSSPMDNKWERYEDPHTSISWRWVVLLIIWQLISFILGWPCDADGHDLPDGSPPAPDSPRPNDNYFPYDSRTDFELADFLFQKEQMSGKKINELMDICAAYQQNDEVILLMLQNWGMFRGRHFLSSLMVIFPIMHPHGWLCHMKSGSVIHLQWWKANLAIKTLGTKWIGLQSRFLARMESGSSLTSCRRMMHGTKQYVLVFIPSTATPHHLQ